MTEIKQVFCFVIISTLVLGSRCQFDQVKHCLDQDSISCLQMQLFRNTRNLMNQESIDLVGGMSLVRESRGLVEKSRETSAEKGLQLLELEELEARVENATDVLSRQEAIENFLVRQARDIAVERTIRWDLGQAIRNLVNSIPLAIKAKFTNYVTEARGKSKKALKILLPLLIGLKLKMAGLSALTYLGIAVLAKKAILASLISLIVSGFIGIKKLLAKQALSEEFAPMHSVPLWAPPHPAIGFEPNRHLEPFAAQKMAYNTYR